MKKSFAILAIALMTVCVTSTALADTPAPVPVDIPQIKVSSVPKLYYSDQPIPMAAPNITWKSPSIIYVEEGKSLTLVVEFTAWPEPSVEVSFNGQASPFINSDDFILSYTGGKGSYVSYLTIKQVYEEDGGIFGFKITNSLGFVNAYMSLIVTQPKH